jgi:hypothetical protein
MMIRATGEPEPEKCPNQNAKSHPEKGKGKKGKRKSGVNQKR